MAADRGGLTAKLTAKLGELLVKFGELAAPGNSSARNPAHGCCQVKRSQSAATITQAIATPMARAVDSIAGAQSARSAALMVVFIGLGVWITNRGRSRSSPGGWEWCVESLRPPNHTPSVARLRVRP